MAAQVTNDILEALLKDLDTLVKATEKAAKTDNASVFSSVGIDPKTVNNQANQAGSFLSIIQNFKSIKKSDVQHMADIMSLMQKTLKGIQLSDNDLKGINNMFKVMGTLNQTFGAMSESIFSTMRKFNSMKGWLLGREIGKFYKQLFKGFEKEKLSDLLANLSTLGAKDKDGKNVVAFASLVQTLFAIDWKQLIKIGIILKMFPEDAGANFAKFIHPIIMEIGNLPDNLQDKSGNLKSGGSANWIANPKIAGFVSIIKTLCSIMPKDVKMLKKLATLKPEQGENISGFLHNLVSKITEEDEEKMRMLSKMMQSFGFMLLAISASVAIMVAIVALADLSTIGIAVGTILVMVGVMHLMVKAFGSKNIQEQSKNAQMTLIILTSVLLAVTIIFGIITSIVKNNDIIDLVLSFLMIVGMIGIMRRMVKAFGNTTIQKQSKDALITLASLTAILLAITLIFGIMTAIVKNNKIEDIGLAIGVMAIMVLFMWGMVKVFGSKSIQNKSKDALITLAGLTLILLVLSFVARSFIEIGKNAGDIGWGAFVVTCIVLAMIGILWLLSKIPKKSLTSGILALAGIVLGIMGITFAVGLYMDLMKKMNELKGEDIADNSGIIALILASVGLAIVGLGLLLSGPQAGIFAIGFAALEMIALAIVSISGSMLLFCKLLDNIHKLQEAGGVETAVSVITDQMVPAIESIVKALLEIGAWSSIKVAMISCNLRPLFTTLGMFTDIISKMANLVVIDSFDDSGRPKFKKMSNEDFTNAATTLAGAFKDFLTVLSTMLEQGVLDNASKVIDMLVGTTTAGGNFLTRIFSSESPKQRPNLKQLFNVLSQFIDLIAKFESGVIETEWDKFGNCTKRVKLSEIAGPAAQTLVGAFNDFLTTLKGMLDTGVLENASKVIDALVGSTATGGNAFQRLFSYEKPKQRPNLKELFHMLSQFTDIIAKFAGGVVELEWDKDGKCTRKVILPQVAGYAAEMLSTSFIDFLKSLSERFLTMSPLAMIALKVISEGDISNLMQGISSFANVILQMASMQIPDKWDREGRPIHFIRLKKEDFTKAAEGLSEAFVNFMTKLSEGSKNLGWWGRRALEKLSECGIDKLISLAGQFLQPVMSLAAGKIKVGDEMLDISGTKVAEATTTLTNSLLSFVTSMNKIPEAKQRDDIKRLLNNIIPSFAEFIMLDDERMKRNAKALETSMSTVFSAKSTIDKIVTGNSFIITDKLLALGKAMEVSEPPAQKLQTTIGQLTVEFSKFHNEIVTKNKERIQAIQDLSDKFGTMTEALNKLNNERERAKELRFGIQEEMVPHVVGLTTAMLSDKIDGILETLYKFPGVGTKSPDQLAQMGDSSTGGGSMDAIRDAIVEGMRAASQEEKILIVKIDGDQAKTLKTTLTSI